MSAEPHDQQRPVPSFLWSYPHSACKESSAQLGGEVNKRMRDEEKKLGQMELNIADILLSLFYSKLVEKEIGPD